MQEAIGNAMHNESNESNANASHHHNGGTPVPSGPASTGPSGGLGASGHGFSSSAAGSSTPTKASSLQNYHMLAFRKALHPEFFGIEGRQRVQHGEYETEAWIFRGGHSLRFALNGFCMSEIVVEHIDQIPDRGLIAALPCAGERDFEEKVADNLVYMTTMQTETLSDHLYLGTYKEMMSTPVRTIRSSRRGPTPLASRTSRSSMSSTSGAKCTCRAITCAPTAVSSCARSP